MKSKEFIIERCRATEIPLAVPLSKYSVRENVGDGKRKVFEEVAGGDDLFLLEALRRMVILARDGGDHRHVIKMLKVRIIIEKEACDGKS